MVITVTCPSCSSSFPVDPAKVPEGGVNARCSSCGDIFRVEKPAEVEPLPTLEDLAPSPDPMTEPSAVEESGGAGPASGASPDEWVMETEEAAWEEAEPLPSIDPLPEIAASDSTTAAQPSEPEVDPFAEAAPFERAAQMPEPPPPPAASEPIGQRADDRDGEGVQGFTFGKRDPTDKAKRLARVLVSDMIMYNAERHQSALSSGTLEQDFEEEIAKSWKEYVEQVGDDLANGPGRDFWRSALNDILAKGQQVF